MLQSAMMLPFNAVTHNMSFYSQLLIFIHLDTCNSKINIYVFVTHDQCRHLYIYLLSSLYIYNAIMYNINRNAHSLF